MIGTYETFEAISRQISMKYHRDFLMIDEKILYHSGASFKNLGNKCFAINRIEDEEYTKLLLNRVKCDFIK